MRAADVIEQVVHLYLVLVDLQQKVNITIKSHFLSKSNQNNVASHHFLGASFRVIDKSAN